MSSVRDMPWRLRPAGLDDATVYAVPAGETGTSVLGWVQQTPDGWRRYPPEHQAPVYPHPELAIMDLIEYTEHGSPR
jgi:hypothetical protein